MARQSHLPLQHQVRKGHKDLSVLRVTPVLREHLVRQVQPVKMVHQDLQVPLEVQGEVDLQVQLVLQEQQVQLVRKVPRVHRK
jgi:hypothetical protein